MTHLLLFFAMTQSRSARPLPRQPLRSAPHRRSARCMAPVGTYHNYPQVRQGAGWAVASRSLFVRVPQRQVRVGQSHCALSTALCKSTTSVSFCIIQSCMIGTMVLYHCCFPIVTGWGHSEHFSTVQSSPLGTPPCARPHVPSLRPPHSVHCALPSQREAAHPPM